MKAVGEPAFCFEGHTLDLRRGCLRAGDREIELRPKSFELLRYLVENAGRLVSKDELIRTVWPNVTVTDESLTRCVSDVRLALHDSEQRIIKTVSRRGYLFDAIVSRTNTGGEPDRDAASQPSPPSPSAAVVVEKAASPRLSIVVLPFSNLSGDPAQDHLADSITDGLTTYLSRIRGSFVIARTTAMTYKGRPVDVRQIARELGVRFVLEGSEQHSGHRMRVNAQLIDAETGAHLWADRFDTDRADLLQLEDDIVTRLARTLQIELAAVQAARISRTRPASADAEELALRGEAIFLRYGPNRDEVEPGYELCERALIADPDNVRALSMLATRFANRANLMQSRDREADLRRAEELVSRALAIDPGFYHAHEVKARGLVARGRPEEAIVESERALGLNPSFIPAYLRLCSASLHLGRPEQSIEYAEKAMRLSPRDPYISAFHGALAYASIMLHHDDDGIDYLRRAIAISPDMPVFHAWLASMLALKGQPVEARGELQHYVSHRRTTAKTIAQLKALAHAEKAAYQTFLERFYDGLRKAGMAEQ